MEVAMSWNLWPSAAPDLTDPDPASPDPARLTPERTNDPGDVVQLVGATTTTTDDAPGCWHVRPVTAREPLRPSPPARRDLSLRRQRPSERPDQSEQSDLHSIGLPEHLVPPEGGIFSLLSLLERLPSARLPALRPSDEIAVVTVASDGHRGSVLEPAELLTDIRRCLTGHAADLDDDDVHLFTWPTEADDIGVDDAEAALVQQVRSLRARVELLVIHPDCAGPIAYAACRALPTAQLYLTGMLAAERPAAPLSWGAPVAFVDGRPANPAVLAAIFADRLAGGVV